MAETSSFAPTFAPRRPSILAGTMIGFGADLVSYVLLFAASIILARFLGPTGRGTYAMIILLNVYAANVLMCGIASVAEMQVANKEYPLGSVHLFAIVFSIVMGFLSLLIFLSFKGWLLNSVLRSIPEPLALVSVLLVSFSIYSNIVSRMMVGMTEIPMLNLIKLFKSILDIAGPVLFLMLIPLGLVGAVTAWVLSTVLAAVAQGWWLFQQDGLKFSFSQEMAAKSLGYGSKIHFAFLPENAIVQLDLFFLNYFRGAHEVGFYVIAYGLTFKIVLFFGALVNASQSRIISYENKESEALTRRLIRHTVFLSGLIALSLVLVGRPLIEWFYGPSFLPASQALFILLIAMMANSAKNFLQTYSVGRLKRPQLSALVNWGDFVFGICLYLWLIPKFGFVGAAAASSLIAGMRVIAYLWLLRWRSGEAIRETFLISKEDILFWKSRFYSLWESFTTTLR